MKAEPMIMPLTGMMTMLLPAPARGRSQTPTRGATTVAAVVIRIGRSRVLAGSLIAPSLSRSRIQRWFANSTVSIPFFATRSTSVMRSI
ncbi:MAG TPA: hypothetical protein VNI83_15745 [Vicinamibacterales bacterium]|nr:hypothetical protein [Vicinamibacterales bacterium]